MLTQEEKIQIAELEGLAKQLGLYEHPISGEYVNPEQLNYDSDWHMIMPVVEKIASHIYETNEQEGSQIRHERAFMRTFALIDNNGKWMTRINRMPLEKGDTLIESVCNSVVGFIQLNKQN